MRNISKLVAFALALLFALPRPATARQNPEVTVELFYTNVASYPDPGGGSRNVGVFVSQIRSVNSYGEDLDIVQFGSPEAPDLSESGWYAPEDIGLPVRYSGLGSNFHTASFTFPRSYGTDGLILLMGSAVAGNKVIFMVDGDYTATRILGPTPNYVYIPIGGARPLPFTSDGPLWSPDRYFPELPTSDRLFVINVRSGVGDSAVPNGGWEKDWRINHSEDAMMALTLVGMQGVINRRDPNVYILWDDSQTNTSDFWLQKMMEAGHATTPVFLHMEPVDAIHFLWRRFGNRFQGAVKYMPDVPDTINIATMYAGAYDRVIICSEQVSTSYLPNFGHTINLRDEILNTAPSGQDLFDGSELSSHLLYSWVYRFSGVWPQLDHRMVAIASPGPPFSGKYNPDDIPNGRFPVTLASRDYMIALITPVIYVDPTTALFSEILGSLDAPETQITPVSGFYAGMEEETVSAVSASGDFVSVMSIPNFPLASANLTVLSGIPEVADPYEQPIREEMIEAAAADIPVVTMFSSDGDAVFFQLDRGYHPNFLMDNVTSSPLGWTMNPILPELSPFVWNHLNQTRGELSFLSGLSGAGYVYPHEMDAEELRTYLQRSSQYLSQTDLRTVRIDGRYLSGGAPGKTVNEYHELWTSDLARAYAEPTLDLLGTYFSLGAGPWGSGIVYEGENIPSIQPLSVLDGYNWDVVGADAYGQDSGVNHFFVPYLDGKRGGTVSGTAYRITTTSPDPVVWTGPGALAPGNHTISFHLKIEGIPSFPTNVPREDQVLAKVYIGSKYARNDSYNTHAFRNIYPDEITEGDFKTFDLFFNTTTSVNEAEIRLDFVRGQALTIDFITASVDDPTGYPKFTAVFVGLVGGASPQYLVDSVRNLENKVLINDGIILTPEEFAASLNPEYMLAFAEARLGTGQPMLDEARAHLLIGEPFLSLVNIRRALQGYTNGAPVAVDDQFTVDEDVLTTLTPKENDSDPNGLELIVTAVGAAANGTATVTDGIVSYRTDRDFNGTDEFTYTIENAYSLSTTGTIHITVNPVNDRPKGEPDVAQVEIGVPVTIDVLSNDTDVEGDALSLGPFDLVSENGTVSATRDGTLTYTSDWRFAGVDEFYYRASDGADNSAKIKVTVTVTGTPPPVAITAPVTNTAWLQGENGLITWSPETAPIGCTRLTIHLADSDGNSLDHLSTRNTDLGEYQWRISDTLPAIDYRILLECLGVDSIAQSDVFTISEPVRSIAITSPDGLSEWQVRRTNAVRWTSEGLPRSGYDTSGAVEILLLSDNHADEVLISSAREGRGAWNYRVPADHALGYFRILVRSLDFPSVFDESAEFEIVPNTRRREVDAGIEINAGEWTLVRLEADNDYALEDLIAEIQAAGVSTFIRNASRHVILPGTDVTDDLRRGIRQGAVAIRADRDIILDNLPGRLVDKSDLAEASQKSIWTDDVTLIVTTSKLTEGEEVKLLSSDGSVLATATVRGGQIAMAIPYDNAFRHIESGSAPSGPLTSVRRLYVRAGLRDMMEVGELEVWDPDNVGGRGNLTGTLERGSVLVADLDLRVKDSEAEGEEDDQFALRNYPNPFNPVTTISFSLKEQANVRLNVYDILGRRVAVLLNEELSPSDYHYRFDASGLPGGVYYYVLDTDGTATTRQMILLK